MSNSKNKPFDLNKNLIAEVVEISPHQAMRKFSFKTDKGLERIIIVPEKHKDDFLCLEIIKYFYSNQFTRLEITTKGVIVASVKFFFTFLDEHINEKKIDRNVLNKYRKKLNEQGYTDKAIYQKIHQIKNILTFRRDDQYQTNSIELEKIIDVINHTKKIQKPTYQPRASLSQLFENCPFDELELLNSLRLFCFEYCRNLTLLREEFSKQYPKEISELINKTNVTGSPKKGKRDLPLEEHDHHPGGTYSEYWFDLFQYANKTENIFLLEYFFYLYPGNWKKYIENNQPIPSLHRIKKLVHQYTTDKNVNIRVKTKISTTGENSTEFLKISPSFHPVDLLRPTRIEFLLLSWILASERIQSGGQKLLKINDFKFIKSKLYIEFKKNRAQTKNLKTRNFHKSEAIYKTINNFIKLHKEFNKANLPHTNMFSFNHENLLPTHSWGMWSSITMLSKPDSHYRYHLTEKFGASLGPFFWLFDNWADQSYQYQKALSKKLSDGSDIPKNLKRTSITLSSISQSAALVLPASRSAHSESVHFNVYKDRSNSKSVIKPAGKFGNQVGLKMEHDAELINKSFPTPELISLKKVEALLGLTPPTEQLSEKAHIDWLLNKLSKEGYDIGLIGEFTKDMQAYIIETPLTAALIMSEIESINSNLDNYLAAYPNREASIKMRLLFLNEIIEMFGLSIINQGKKILMTHTFPSPVLF